VTWLPDGFVHPTRVDVAAGFHLRPIRAADVDLDYLAHHEAEVEAHQSFNHALFDAPRHIGRDLTWAERLALPRA
jgi:hypothetical protein